MDDLKSTLASEGCLRKPLAERLDLSAESCGSSSMVLPQPGRKMLVIEQQHVIEKLAACTAEAKLKPDAK